MLYLFLFLVVIATISPAIVGCVIAASTGNPLWLLLWIISFAAILRMEGDKGVCGFCRREIVKWNQ
jgi:hypothetical protein